jgi:hypothetical protein
MALHPQFISRNHFSYIAYMSTKSLIYILLTIGSIAGGWIPTLWGADALSFQSVAGAFIGGMLGIWVGFKLGQYIGS